MCWLIHLVGSGKTTVILGQPVLQIKTVSKDKENIKNHSTSE